MTLDMLETVPYSPTRARRAEAAAAAPELAMMDSAPCAKLKLDELLFTFLAQPTTQALVETLVREYEAGHELPELTTAAPASPVLSSPRRFFNKSPHSPQVAQSPPRSPRSPRALNFLSPRSPGSPSLSGITSNAIGAFGPSSPATPRARAKSLAKTLASVASPTPTGGRAESKAGELIIPRFYNEEPEIDPVQHAVFEKELARFFDPHEKDGGVPFNEFVVVCRELCGFPAFFSGPLFRRVRLLWDRKDRAETKSTVKESKEEKDLADVDEESLRVTKAQFRYYFETELEPFDEDDRFFRLVKQPDARVIVPSDFAPFLDELLAIHSGLEFLENTPEFQEKYARTVIARILYEVNTALDGKITRRELRRSDLLAVCHQVDEEDDINAVLRYFSYEHFYTLYVKFYELDTDRDFLLSPEDLMRHGGHSLTPAIVERIFQQPVHQFFSGVPGRMGYEDFVFFFLAEEDKTNAVSLRYWFKCVDLDGDGVIRLRELRHFYDQQLTRLQMFGHEIISFADIVCQAHDFVHPVTESALVLSDFTKPSVTQLSGMLFNILFNLNKFIAFEQRDPYYVRQLHENPHLTEWDRYAAIEYARLASAEEEREMEEASWSGADKYDGSSWLQFNDNSY